MQKPECALESSRAFPSSQRRGGSAERSEGADGVVRVAKRLGRTDHPGAPASIKLSCLPSSARRGTRVSSPERTQVFAYINADNAPLYRTIMRVFMESKQRFLFKLCPQDVLEAVRISVGKRHPASPK